MEMSGNEGVRPFQANSGIYIHQKNISASVGIQPLLGKSWKPSVAFNNRPFSSIGLQLTNKILPISSNNLKPKFRDHHPYRKNQIVQYTNSKTINDNIPSLIPTDNETGPKPLIPHETLEQLTRLRNSCNQVNPSIQDWTYKNQQDTHSISCVNDSSNTNNYMLEEKDTKQKIDEIIKVAQALREKIKREEEIRQISGAGRNSRECNCDQTFPHAQTPSSVESVITRPLKTKKIISGSVINSIPRLMDLKPKIPNLMDLCVTPPDMENVIQENIMVAKNRYDLDSGSSDKCWNCERSGHRFAACKSPKLKKFCFRCGRPGFDVLCCPYCKIWATKPLKLKVA